MATQSDRIKLRKIKAYAIIVLAVLIIIGLAVLLLTPSSKKPGPKPSVSPSVSVTPSATNQPSIEPTSGTATPGTTQPGPSATATVGTTPTVRPTATTPVQSGGLEVGNFCLLKGDNVNFRKDATTTSQSYGKLKKGTVLLIMEVNCGDGSWTKVKKGDEIGYVSTQFIESAQRKIINVNENLKVRSGPGTSYDQSDLINKGDIVTIIANSTDAQWVQIQYGNGKTGYVMSKYLGKP